MKKNFVTFYSPGTFVAETDEKPIESWDVNLAMKMAKEIHQRYNATPYGFKFSTRERGENDLDSKVSATSNMYYLGGEVYTVKQLKELNDPNNKILIENMECNGWERCIINTNSWKWTQPLEKDDIVLKFDV
jgi:hypothetical protein